MKIAITGSGGFLGRELLSQLYQYKNITAYAFTSGKVNTFYGSNIAVLDNNFLKSFDFSTVDVLLNCAFPRATDDISLAQGLAFTERVLQKAAADRVSAVINISSQSVYSQKRIHAADEREPVVPETKYALGKYAVELMVNALFHNVPHTNLRMASLIGPGFNHRITNRFAEMIRNGQQITIQGGQQQFGFMDVRDAADGIIHVLLNCHHMKETYNFGTNESYSLEEIASYVEIEGRRRGYVAPPMQVNEADIRQNSSLVCDQFFKDFKWKPRYGMQSSVKNIFDHL